MKFLSRVGDRPQWDSYWSSHLSMDGCSFCLLKEEGQGLDQKPELQAD